MTQTELTAKITEIEEELSRLRKMSSDATSGIDALREKLKDPTNWTMNDTEESINADITKTQSTQTEIEKQIKAGEEILEQYKAMTPTNEITTATAKNTMTEEEKARNAALAAQHPERVVDGVYYASDDALQKAKEAYDKRIAEETKQANAEAIAKANNLAAAMKRINETLYGTDNAEVISQLQGSVGGAELSSILGNATTIRARQHLLNFKTFKNDFKEPNAGKRQNSIVQRYVTNPNKRQSYVFNYNVFSTIDSEAKAYWLGFLMADAYVDQDSIELCIKAEDIEHLKLFKALFQGIVPEIKYKASANAYRLLLCSVELCKDLADKGCIHGKLLRTFPDKDKMPETLVHHFMRGYFDGDGSIYIDKHNSLHFSVIGSSHFLDQYENILISHCDNKNIPCRRSQSKTGIDCQEIRYGGNKRCADIYRFLYHNATIYLQRKKVNFDIVFMPS